MDLKKKLAALREERAQLVEKRKALLDNAETETRALNEAEDAEYKAHDARGAELDKEIERVEKLIDDERRAMDKRLNDGEGKGGRFGMDDVVIRASRRSLELFGGKAGEEAGFRSGMWARAAIWGDQRAQQWCIDNSVDYRAQSEANFAKGGALVPEQLSNVIIDLREEYGLARRLLRVYPMSGDTLSINRRKTGVTAYFVGEAAEVTASDKSWDQVTLTARKLAALTRFSRELAEDAVIDIAADLAMEMAYAFAVKEDDCYLNGDGTSTYGGIWGIRSKIIDGTHAAGAKDAASGHDTFAEIDADDLNLLLAALPVYAQNGARWLISQPGKALVFDALAAATGGNTIMSIGERPRPTYLGYPIEVSQAMPTATSDISDTAMILFGNFGLAGAMGDRRGFAVQTLQERYAEYGQIGVIGWERFDIVNHDLGDTSAAGPVVALIGE